MFSSHRSLHGIHVQDEQPESDTATQDFVIKTQDVTIASEIVEDHAFALDSTTASTNVVETSAPPDKMMLKPRDTLGKSKRTHLIGLYYRLKTETIEA